MALQRDDDPESVARRCYRAYVKKDRAAIERLIADDFHFTSPLDNRIDRRTYFERCWPNSRWISGYEFIAVVQEGERIFVTYEARSDEGRSFRKHRTPDHSRRQARPGRGLFRLVSPSLGPAGGFLDEAGTGSR
jgi:hypothetical protein